MTKTKTMVIIMNHRASGVELPGKLSDSSHAIHNGQMLLPGENNVERIEWDRVKKNKTVKMYLACDILEYKGEGIAHSLGDGLDALEKHEALKKVAQCSSVKILNDWKSKTSDKSIAKKCNEKINELIEAQGNE